MTGGAGSPIRSALLSVEDDKGCVIFVKTEIQINWIPSQAEDDGRGWIPHQVRDDGGGGSPIRSASLSVEDDGGVDPASSAG